MFYRPLYCIVGTHENCCLFDSFRSISRIFTQSAHDSKVTFNSAACKRIPRSGAYHAISRRARNSFGFFPFLSLLFTRYSVKYCRGILWLENDISCEQVAFRKKERKPSRESDSRARLLLRPRPLPPPLPHPPPPYPLFGDLPKRSREGSPALESRHRSTDVTVPWDIQACSCYYLQSRPCLLDNPSRR